MESRLGPRKSGADPHAGDVVDIFLHTFAQSGVRTWIFLPPLVAFAISFLTSMGGVSGAFLLLPFQVSVLGYATPSVSATNHVFNVAAIPSGVLAYVKEKRMLWPLTLMITMGTLPGVFVGAWVRIVYLPDPRNFKFFAGIVLLYIGARLLKDVFFASRGKPGGQARHGDSAAAPVVAAARLSVLRGSFDYADVKYRLSTPAVLALSLIVGVVGGIYGIGGGAIMAPILVTFFGLPVHAVAGAALMGTFITSVAAVVFYQLLAFQNPLMPVSPDWALGLLFAAGGIPGMYLGARFQRRVPARAIKFILCACVLFVAIRYVTGLVR